MEIREAFALTRNSSYGRYGRLEDAPGGYPLALAPFACKLGSATAWGRKGVWSFLRLVLLPEIGPWRSFDRAQDRLLGHPRNVFRPSWWRAHVLGAGLDAVPEGQPLGEDELVQIMERPTLAANPAVARAVRDGVFRGAPHVAAARSELARDLTSGCSGSPRSSSSTSSTDGNSPRSSTHSSTSPRPPSADLPRGLPDDDPPPTSDPLL
jgi:hypothetical protein